MRRLTRLLVCVGVLVVSLVAPGSVLATTGVLVVAADTTLTEDHHGNVWLAEDSVTLDCAGHSVIGPVGTDPWPLVGIAGVARSDVAIRNCHVEGFGHGISLSGVTSFQLVGNTSTANTHVGIGLYDARDGTVSRNVVRDNGWWGISAQNASDIQFALNRVERNGYDGFRLHTPWPQAHYSTGIRLVGNLSVGNGWNGFSLEMLADGNTVVGNVASNNQHGFMIGSSHNTLTLNVAMSNRYTGFVAAGRPSPLLLPQAEPAVGNTVRLNVAARNGVFDAADFNPPGTNTWLRNWFGTTHGI